jgi:very-short-patch-repair endonuclease
MSPQITRFFDYNKALIERARDNRKAMTMAERRMWHEIIPNLPARVMRQRVIGNYIADFYCASKKLVIEVDGDSHYSDVAQGYDRIRTDYFESLGIRVVRYTNDNVLGNPDEVMKDLLRILEIEM